jgi:hypothetical protein
MIARHFTLYSVLGLIVLIGIALATHCVAIYYAAFVLFVLSLFTPARLMRRRSGR